MRKIKPLEFITFALLVIAAISLASIFLFFLCNKLIDSNSLHFGFNIESLILLFVLSYFFIIIAYRLFLRLCPLKVGDIPIDSQQQFVYHVYILFFLFFFYPFLLSFIIPVPFLRLKYRLLGAKLGENTYPSGLIYDPTFVTIGSNGIIGAGSKIIPHALEGNSLAHFPIVLGDNVTIGVNSTILAGCEIGDNAIVAAHSLVTKHTKILAGEVWAGVPAKKIK